MIKEIIDKATKTNVIVEMEYSKDGVSSKYYQLSKVGCSDLNNCFSGRPISSDKELTFNINRVRSIQLMWDFVFEENIQLVKSGIYVISFMGDNYLEFGLYYYDKGDNILDHYQFGLWALFAYHYIPSFSETNINQWHIFDITEKAKEDSIYVIAYTIEQKNSVNKEQKYNLLISRNHFQTIEHAGIIYTAIRLREGQSFGDFEINEGVNILAFSRCRNFTYDNLRVYNDICFERKK